MTSGYLWPGVASSPEPLHLILLCRSSVASLATCTVDKTSGDKKLLRQSGSPPPTSDRSTILRSRLSQQRCRQTQVHVKGFLTHYTSLRCTPTWRAANHDTCLRTLTRR